MFRILLITNLLMLSLARYSPTVTAYDNLAFKFEQPPGLGINATGGVSVEKTVENIVVNVVSILFAVGGIGVVVYFVWGAVDWILSGGDKEKVSNARKKMTHALIGLALLSLSFVIINLVGTIVGFNPLGNLQLRNLGTKENPVINNPWIQ